MNSKKSSGLNDCAYIIEKKEESIFEKNNKKKKKVVKSVGAHESFNRSASFLCEFYSNFFLFFYLFFLYYRRLFLAATVADWTWKVQVSDAALNRSFDDNMQIS